MQVLADVAKILFLGKRCILKCLLQLRHLFEHTDTHYLLNKLYIDDYCVWIQGVSDESLKAVAKEFNEAKSAIETNRQPVTIERQSTRQSHDKTAPSQRFALPPAPVDAACDSSSRISISDQPQGKLLGDEISGFVEKTGNSEGIESGNVEVGNGDEELELGKKGIGSGEGDLGAGKKEGEADVEEGKDRKIEERKKEPIYNLHGQASTVDAEVRQVSAEDLLEKSALLEPSQLQLPSTAVSPPSSSSVSDSLPTATSEKTVSVPVAAAQAQAQAPVATVQEPVATVAPAVASSARRRTQDSSLLGLERCDPLNPAPRDGDTLLSIIASGGPSVATVARSPPTGKASLGLNIDLLDEWVSQLGDSDNWEELPEVRKYTVNKSNILFLLKSYAPGRV